MLAYSFRGLACSHKGGKCGGTQADTVVGDVAESFIFTSTGSRKGETLGL